MPTLQSQKSSVNTAEEYKDAPDTNYIICRFAYGDELYIIYHYKKWLLHVGCTIKTYTYNL